MEGQDKEKTKLGQKRTLCPADYCRGTVKDGIALPKGMKHVELASRQLEVLTEVRSVFSEATWEGLPPFSINSCS